MKHNLSILASVALVSTVALSCTKQEGPKPWDEEPVRTDIKEKGFYKDLFMDGGVRLTGRTTLPSATTLGLSMEFFACPSAEEELGASDTLYQGKILSDNELDDNGVLLYPDGEPRFRMIYMNGGKSTAHTESLIDSGKGKGISNIRNFYYNGGGYLGTCAGAFMTGTGYDATESFTYLRFCTFKPQHTKVNEKYMSMKLESNCPLKQYETFSGNIIADIYHNGGCYANEGLCAGAEVLLRYNTAGHTDVAARNVDGKIGSWAYKKDIYSGRLCAIGSHPEGVSSGDRLKLMCAFEKYAMDGAGIATVKDTLFNGKEVAMTKTTSDKDPNHTKIGDLQNHHFAVWVPAGARNLMITLIRQGGETYEDCELDLLVKKGNFAFIDETIEYAAINDLCSKGINIDTPEKGLYYVCVHCATTVESAETTYNNEKSKTGTYFKYSGHTEVLNGVPYTIKATWEE